LYEVLKKQLQVLYKYEYKYLSTAQVGLQVGLQYHKSVNLCGLH